MSAARRTTGFTLIEVLVAVSIMAIGLVAVLRTGIQSQETILASDRISTASLLAADTMARVQALGPDGMTVRQGDFGEQWPDYFWSMESQDHGHPGLTHIVVTVDWQGNTFRPVKLEAYLFDDKATLR